MSKRERKTSKSPANARLLTADGNLSDRISITLSTDSSLLQTIGSMIPETNALIAFNECMNNSSARNTIEIQYLFTFYETKNKTILLN